MKARREHLTHFFAKLSTSVRKRLGLGHSLSEIDPGLAARPLHFEAPKLTEELVAAIRRISPQFRFRADEASRRYWELNQNGLCWGEYDALAPVLDDMPRPTKVLDIGPGMGRSIVFFKKKLDWRDVPFHLYESSGEDTNYTKAGPRFDDSFCGDLDVLRVVLERNGIESFELFDAMNMDSSLAGLPGPYDFVYSFFAVGFHWALEHFLDEILDQMHDGSVGAFTLHDRVTNLAALEGRVAYRVVEFKRSWPRGRWSNMVVLSPDPDRLAALDEA